MDNLTCSVPKKHGPTAAVQHSNVSIYLLHKNGCVSPEFSFAKMFLWVLRSQTFNLAKWNLCVKGIVRSNSIFFGTKMCACSDRIFVFYVESIWLQLHSSKWRRTEWHCNEWFLLHLYLNIKMMTSDSVVELYANVHAKIIASGIICTFVYLKI